MPERGEVPFGSTTIVYDIVRSSRRKKTVALSLSARGLEVRVPEQMSRSKVAELVAKKAPWVVVKQQYFERLLRSAEPPRRFVDGETLRYLGRHYRLKRVAGTGKVKLKGRYFEVPDVSEEEVRTALVAWYRSRAAHHLAEQVAVYSRKLGKTPASVLVRDQKKRWGSCNAKGELRFNWRIVMAPLPLIDYVVVHELCHLEHLNHSVAFWRRLAQLYPKYSYYREQLELQGVLYTL